MDNDKIMVPAERIEQLIVLLRRQKVILDRDLARLYGVSTSVLNKAVSRNIDRFPSDFMIQLTREELLNLKFHFGTSSWGGTRKLPRAFTEQGAFCESRTTFYLMAEPEKPKRKIGFEVKEKVARYQANRKKTVH